MSITPDSNKHAKNLIAATTLYPRQITQQQLFEIMENAAAELDRLEANQLQAELAEWAKTTLPAGADSLKKLQEEVRELTDTPDDPMEIGDVLLALMLHASHLNIDVIRAAHKKFAIVKARQYGQPDASGVSRHITDQGNTETFAHFRTRFDNRI